MAALWFKAFIQRLIGARYFRYYRLVYSGFASLTLVAILIFQFSMDSKLLMNPTTPTLFMGLLFSLIGMGIMAACIKKYFFNLSGVDVLTKQNGNQVLEESGLHSYVRHPLYSGTLLFIWSLFIIFPFLDNLLACIIITVYTVIGIGMEERKLLIKFGDSYITYSRNIPMLIPSLRKFVNLKRRNL